MIIYKIGILRNFDSFPNCKILKNDFEIELFHKFDDFRHFKIWKIFGIF